MSNQNVLLSSIPSTAHIWRLGAVIVRTGKARTSIYDGIAAGTFPAPVRIGLRAVGWRESDLAKWEASLQSTRDAIAA